MKKIITLFIVFAILFSLSSCSFIADRKAIKDAVTKIEAEELNSAITTMKTMSEKTLDVGKKDILNAVIRKLNTYLAIDLWVSTDYTLVDEKVIGAVEKYQTIISFLPLTANESNVDDFISKILLLKPYTKWNTYHATGSGEEFAEIKNTMDQGASYSSSSIKLNYYKQAYNMCMNAYYRYSNSSDYGMKEVADFLYNFAIQTNAIITRTKTTSSQDNAYTTTAAEFKRITQENLTSYEEILEIVESFPTKLY